MNTPSDDRPRVAIVTGGATGIGLATVRQLVADGYRVTLCSRNADRVAAAAASIGADDRVLGVASDVSAADAAEAMVAQTVHRFGGLDVVINAHGIQGPIAPLEELSLDQWREVLDVNLLGVVAMTKAAIPHMRERGGGAIVNIASIDAVQADLGIAAYGVSKAAVVTFTQYAAFDLARYGIRVNAVSPGWVRTDMTEPWIVNAGVSEAPVDTNMQGRIAEPAELAHVLCFLASPQASYVTGAMLMADGGQTVMLRELRRRN
jgi:NAD(P)-dependent dehydrogenase (short-subunit alcohol dehydrogenase family)